MFWRHSAFLQFLLSTEYEYGVPGMSNLEAGEIVISAARRLQPINLREIWSLCCFALGLAQLGDMIGDLPTYRYETMILPRFGPDQSSIQDYSGFNSTRHGVPDKDLPWIETWLAQICTNPSCIGSHPAPWRYLCYMSLHLLHYFVQSIYTVDSNLCRLTWRQLPLPEGHQAKRIQKK